MNDVSAPPATTPCGAEEHSAKVQAIQPAITNRLEWTHAFGRMVIETCADGSVWIDGKPVPETLPQARPVSSL